MLYHNDYTNVLICILRHAFKYEYEIFNHFNNSLKLLKVHKGKMCNQKRDSSELLK